MLVLGIDLETTGLNVNQDKIIEVGAVLWDWKKSRPIKMFNEMVKIDSALPAEITAITGIEEEDLARWGQPLGKVLADTFELARDAEFVVAHNGNQFDKNFLERDWMQFPETRIGLEWIDTMTDLPFPEEMGTRKLSYLAAEHGFLNPFAHRASFDVFTMLKILSRYPMEDVLKLKSSPLRRVIAKVTYDEREKAKTEGFRWDPAQKHWYIEAKECQLEGRQFPFAVITL